ncbi:MAG: DUF1122 family protein [Chloroflexi bacterium]|nr:DUF1122 family protein [Chloroflexota bacterium]
MDALKAEPEDSLPTSSGGWHPIQGKKEHPLGILEGQKLGTTSLHILLGPKNRFGARYFQIFLKDALGRLSDQPTVFGLYSSGKYPSYNWIEIIRLSTKLTFTSEDGHKNSTDLHLEGADQQLLQYLADLIPPGGHLMVEYESPEQETTARSLVLGMPAVATPLGSLLYRVGCGAGFKDWSIAEGGNEGPRKLQGYKALNSEQARFKAEAMAEELIAFLRRLPNPRFPELERPARQRAIDILRSLKLEKPDLARRAEEEILKASQSL